MHYQSGLSDCSSRPMEFLSVESSKTPRMELEIGVNREVTSTDRKNP